MCEQLTQSGFYRVQNGSTLLFGVCLYIRANAFGGGGGGIDDKRPMITVLQKFHCHSTRQNVGILCVKCCCSLQLSVMVLLLLLKPLSTMLLLLFYYRIGEKGKFDGESSCALWFAYRNQNNKHSFE
jgi:hypothetical protein